MTSQHDSRAGRRRRSGINGFWAYHRIAMLESPPWRALSLSAHRALDRLEIEHWAHRSRENGRLIVTFKQFEDYGIPYGQIAPAIREVVALGFLKVTKQGRAGNAEFREPSQYRLTYWPVHGGDNPLPATEEWERIKTDDEAQERKRAARAAVNHGYRKRKTSAGKRPNARPETGTETRSPQRPETSTTAKGRKPALQSISRGGRSGGGGGLSRIPPSRGFRSQERKGGMGW